MIRQEYVKTFNVTEIKVVDVRPDYYRCDICGEECGKKDPKLRGNPRISHMECAEKEAKEIRDRVRKIKINSKM